ncbi:hypothetical protein E6O75_ATG11484 [Venturia nashicola]|uniref:Uncharacterized protein n=1 Tax=Venturia nashicola TaxID=86259 RepID=A0A4Z1NKJ3_9PEZI|nr:hypothetical protein E6O75_ATG11484 [Venturia nashicola]
MSDLATENQYLELRIKENAAARHHEPPQHFGIVTRITKCAHHPIGYQAHLVAHDTNEYILQSSEIYYSEELMEGINDALLDLLEKVVCEIEGGHVKKY